MPLMRRVLALGAFLLAMPMAVRAQTDSERTVPIAPLTRVAASAWGASVWVIDSAEIAKSTAQTFSELLQARRPGVRVFRSSGMVTDGALVMLRGPTSLTGSNEPLVIVDGVRVDSRQSDRVPTDVGTSTAPSRLNDLIPEDIQRIVILSGPAAAVFGEGAANGVILVTTKSGGTGPVRLRGRATWDARQIHNTFPANYRRVGVSPATGQPAIDCSLSAIANGQCTPTRLDVWNPLQQASPFRIGNSARGHLELGGTALGTAIFVGATGDRQQGTLPHDEGSRLALRSKVNRVLPWHLGLDLSGGYLSDDSRLGVEGNTTLESNIVANGLLGAATDDSNRGYRVGLGSPGDSLYPDQRLRHSTIGARLRWQPLTWLGAAVATGEDRVTSRWDDDYFGTATSALSDARAFDRHELRSSSAVVTASYAVRQLSAMTAIGAERVTFRTASADTLIAPGGSFATASSEFITRSTSLWLSGRATLAGRLTLGASVEHLASALLGANAGKEWFPSADASWKVPFRRDGVDEVRLRAAYAEAAGASPSLDQLFAQGAASPFAAPGALPKMERTRSCELGADATLGSTRVSLTAFTASSTHLWSYFLAPPPGGEGFAHDAAMRNSGVEAWIAAPLIDAQHVRWSGALSLASLRNRVTHLSGPPQIGGTTELAPGYPFGGVWAGTYTYDDANHDGIIAENEVRMGSMRYFGPGLPTFESSLGTDLELPGHIALSGAVDYRSGGRVFDRTGAIRCDYDVCRASQDPSTSLPDQAASVANMILGLDNAGYVGNGTFLRVREIALHWMIPAGWAGVVSSGTELTIAGRNLATWTRYRGLDPEISYEPPGVLPRQEFLMLPLPREFIVRLDIGGAR